MCCPPMDMPLACCPSPKVCELLFERRTVKDAKHLNQVARLVGYINDPSLIAQLTHGRDALVEVFKLGFGRVAQAVSHIQAALRAGILAQ